MLNFLCISHVSRPLVRTDSLCFLTMSIFRESYFWTYMSFAKCFWKRAAYKYHILPAQQSTSYCMGLCVYGDEAVGSLHTFADWLIGLGDALMGTWVITQNDAHISCSAPVAWSPFSAPNTWRTVKHFLQRLFCLVTKTKFTQQHILLRPQTASPSWKLLLIWSACGCGVIHDSVKPRRNSCPFCSVAAQATQPCWPCPAWRHG